MTDVLEQGGPEGPRRRVPYVVVAVVVVAALVAYGVARSTGAIGGAAAPASPSATPADPALSGQLAGVTVKGPCSTLAAPRYTAAALTERTRGAVLTGGPVLQLVDLDTGQRDLVLDPSGRPPRHGFVADVAVRGDIAYALVRSCNREPGGAVYAIPRHRKPRLLLRDGASTLLAGPAGVWVVTYPRGDGGRAVLRGIVGRTFSLSRERFAEGVSRTGVVVVSPGGDGGRMSVYDPATGRSKVRVDHGVPLRVDGDDLVWYRGSECGPGAYSGASPCVVHRTGLGSGHDRAYRLPPGWSQPQAARISPDGSRLAMVLGRYEPPRGGIPARFGTLLAVLDLRTGRLDQVPGLRFPGSDFPGVGLAFLPRGGWLVVSVGEGATGHLLLWRPGLTRLRQASGQIIGPIDGYAPVVPAPP